MRRLTACCIASQAQPHHHQDICTAVNLPFGPREILVPRVRRSPRDGLSEFALAGWLAGDRIHVMLKPAWSSCWRASDIWPVHCSTNRKASTGGARGIHAAAPMCRWCVEELFLMLTCFQIHALHCVACAGLLEFALNIWMQLGLGEFKVRWRRCPCKISLSYACRSLRRRMPRLMSVPPVSHCWSSALSNCIGEGLG